MSIKVGIVSAMSREVAPFLKGWRRGTLRDGAMVYQVWRSGLGTYIQSGIGREPGISATRALVKCERPDVLISTGLAGALVAGIAVADVFRVGKVIDGQTGDTFRTVSGTTVLVSAPTIVDQAAKSQLRERYAAELVDMEAAAVARVALENDIPFVAVKSVSDEFVFPMPPFARFVSSEGELATAKFVLHAAMRPETWPALLRLAQNSAKASRSLSIELQKFIANLSGTESSKLPHALDVKISVPPTA